MNPRIGIYRRSIKVWCFLFLLGTAFSVGAVDFEGAEVDYSLRILASQQDDLEDGSTAAVWTNVLGARFPILLPHERLSVVPGISFTTLYYRYDTENERAVPTDAEWRELTALVPVLDFTLRWELLNRGWGSIDVESGLGFQLPVPLKTWTTGPEDNSGKITPALYSGAQFVLPELAIQANWPISEKFEVLTRVSGYLPVYRLWDGKGLPITDGLVVGLHVGAFFPF